ncbi:Calycin-like protein [Lentinula raphanica]|uniref:Calycin-like protein n=1 Tax=Lentinula raphanica TaxID=153919 RepID=A0AA38P1S6_9AGAR|nr:Calycin-like protein [Lentinula raphanica]KAJ3748247.1 Calycin-like protein [Lentinula raphanica]KAJ3769930.1 Calycin-like protein [Lentinula raphanica]KAJ3819997.1 Calycin-like protein [Lentinula raphanica]KAJ3834684.1 Calycin-like protein [Lentinula raphanica]
MPTFLTASNNPLINKHFVYEFDNLEGYKARYEAWCQSEDTIVYKMHGGPFKGRSAYQKAFYQKLSDEDEIYLVSWIEEVGTSVSLCMNLKEKTITGFLSFSPGHYRNWEVFRGDKWDPETLDHWRKLGDFDNKPVHRIPYKVYARIVEITEGPGDLKARTEADPFF